MKKSNLNHVAFQFVQIFSSCLLHFKDAPASSETQRACDLHLQENSSPRGWIGAGVSCSYLVFHLQTSPAWLLESASSNIFIPMNASCCKASKAVFYPPIILCDQQLSPSTLEFGSAFLWSQSFSRPSQSWPIDFGTSSRLAYSRTGAFRVFGRSSLYPSPTSSESKQVSDS